MRNIASALALVFALVGCATEDDVRVQDPPCSESPCLSLSCEDGDPTLCTCEIAAPHDYIVCVATE